MMASVIPLRQTRSVDDVLSDLRAADHDRCEAYREFRRASRESDYHAYVEANDRMGAAEDRIAELRAEFAALFLAATGTEWKHVERAIEEALL